MVEAGTEGAVSLEGTAASLVGAVLFSSISCSLGLISSDELAAISAIAWIASLLESLIGAELQPRLSWLSNEGVNGLMTLIAALLAMALVR